MATIPTIDETIDPQLNAYYEQMSALMAVALAGNIDKGEFEERMERLVLSFLLLAYLLGGGTTADAESDPDYQERVEQNINSVGVLADDIYSGRYSESDKQTTEDGAGKLDNRLTLWVFGIAAAYNLGKNKQPDIVFIDGVPVEYTETFRLGNTERHCKTCSALDGVTLTPSEWDRLGIGPQSPDLECGGWNCDCSKKPEGKPSDGLANVARALRV